MNDAFEKYDETLRLTEDMLKGSLAAIQLQRQGLAFARSPFTAFAQPNTPLAWWPLLGAINNE